MGNVFRSKPAAAGYQPVPSVDIVSPPLPMPVALALPATSTTSTPTLEAMDKGLNLEYPVIIIMLISMFSSVTLVYFGMATIWDRGVPGINVIGWVYFMAAIMGWDTLYFAMILILMNPKCRTVTKRGGVFEVYRDSWYVSHFRLASVMWGISVVSFLGIYLGYFMSFGGEDPWKWPSAYNVERWEKVTLWRGLQQLSTGIRLYALLDKYYLTFRELAEPGRIPQTTKQD